MGEHLLTAGKQWRRQGQQEGLTSQQPRWWQQQGRCNGRQEAKGRAAWAVQAGGARARVQGAASYSNLARLGITISCVQASHRHSQRIMVECRQQARAGATAIGALHGRRRAATSQAALQCCSCCKVQTAGVKPRLNGRVRSTGAPSSKLGAKRGRPAAAAPAAAARQNRGPQELLAHAHPASELAADSFHCCRRPGGQGTGQSNAKLGGHAAQGLCSPQLSTGTCCKEPGRDRGSQVHPS